MSDPNVPIQHVDLPRSELPIRIVAERGGEVVWSATVTDAGVLNVPPLDPPPERVTVFYGDGREEILYRDEGLDLDE